MTGMKHPRITCSDKVMAGKPVIRGTRITVELILRELGAGVGPERLLLAYPRLAAEDVQAALAYAAEHMPRPLTAAA